MAGSTFGTLFRVTSWGESHGKALGVVVDGCPAGLPLSEDDIQKYLDRRKPGQSRFTTARSEGDRAEILSGVFEGKTTGTPISILVRNQDQHSKDYSNIADIYRPGHADLGFDRKYGLRDYRGGGRSSGRETIGRVAAGAIACRILERKGIRVTAYTKAIGPVSCDPGRFDSAYLKESTLGMPDREAEEQAQAYLNRCMEEKDSAGGIVECVITGMPQGIGEPVFDKLDALLAHAVLSIGAVKGIEFGSGFEAADSTGRDNNDPIRTGPAFLTNNAGGILGGISNGDELVFRAAVKPVPSIYMKQETLDTAGNECDILIEGRHDVCLCPRIVPVIEAMTAITLADCLIRNRGARA